MMSIRPVPQRSELLKPARDSGFLAFVQWRVVADEKGKIYLRAGWLAYRQFALDRGDVPLAEEAFAEGLNEIAQAANGVRVEDRFLGLRLR